MKIIVGLGNPGLRYRNTRHNVGFLVVKALAEKHGLSLRRKGFNGQYGIGRIDRQETMLFMPLTYMNLSGEAVESICASKLENKKNLLIVSDEVNLEFGSIRLREKGSAGGHNGLRSVINKIGVDFARLRIGVGSTEGIEDMSSYVLAPFPRKERKLLDETVQKAVGCAEMWLARDIKEVMSSFN